MDAGGAVTAGGAGAAGGALIMPAVATGASAARAPAQGDTGPSASSGMSERAVHWLPGRAGAPAGDAGRKGAPSSAAGRTCSGGAGGRDGTIGAPQGPVRGAGTAPGTSVAAPGVTAVTARRSGRNGA